MEVGLVLSGGGARGFAHIGVLRALAERKIEPVAIAGCSMGGIIGALAANGLTAEEIHRRFKEMNWKKIFDWAKMGSLVGGRGIGSVLAENLPRTFAELKIPLRVTAVDVQEGRVITLWEGDLVPALRATSAIPGIFSPVELNGRMLVDGGLLDNVPVGEIRSMTHAPIVAADVTVPPDRKLVFHDTRPVWKRLNAPFREGRRPLMIELLTKAYDIPVAALTEIRIAALRPEILIRPKLGPGMNVESFKRMDEAVEKGYQEAISVLDLYSPRGS